MLIISLLFFRSLDITKIPISKRYSRTINLWEGASTCWVGQEQKKQCWKQYWWWCSVCEYMIIWFHTCFRFIEKIVLYCLNKRILIPSDISFVSGVRAAEHYLSCNFLLSLQWFISSLFCDRASWKMFCYVIWKWHL